MRTISSLAVLSLFILGILNSDVFGQSKDSVVARQDSMMVKIEEPSGKKRRLLIVEDVPQEYYILWLSVNRIFNA